MQELRKRFDGLLEQHRKMNLANANNPPSEVEKLPLSIAKKLYNLGLTQLSLYHLRAGFQALHPFGE